MASGEQRSDAPLWQAAGARGGHAAGHVGGDAIAAAARGEQPPLHARAGQVLHRARHRGPNLPPASRPQRRQLLRYASAPHTSR